MAALTDNGLFALPRGKEPPNHWSVEQGRRWPPTIRFVPHPLIRQDQKFHRGDNQERQAAAFFQSADYALINESDRGLCPHPCAAELMRRLLTYAGSIAQLLADWRGVVHHLAITQYPHMITEVQYIVESMGDIQY